jgi:RND superfamily putative drug exporter
VDRLFERLGRFVVRYRYLVVLFWLVVIVVSARALPSLSSEINNDNSQFLPANAPSQQANALAAPLIGNPDAESPLYVIAARSSGPIGPADEVALERLARADAALPKVQGVRLVAVAPTGHAALLLVQVHLNVSDVQDQKAVVDELQSSFAAARPPAGLQLHLAGQVATNVANQVSSQRTGNRTQALSFLLIIVILLLIFRSVLAPIVTLVPAGVALAVSERFIGGLGASGLKISIITELLLIVLLLGAGTDYGLFLVFRVREELRNGLEPREAVVHALVRVGESISASAGTVVFALLSLLLASFGIYKDLAIPLAVGVGVMLIAGLTLLPALLAISGRALFWPSPLVPGVEREGWWGRTAAQLVRRPAATLSVGLVLFTALSLIALGYHSGGFGGALDAPAGTDAAAGNALQARYFPQSSANPANLVLAYQRPVWQDPQVLAEAEASLRSSGDFAQLQGPLDPNGTALTPAELARLHAELGNARLLTGTPPPGVTVSPALYDAYRSTQQFLSADGRTVQFAANLRAGDQGSNGAMAATPAIRAALARAGRASGASATGVAGEAAALYDVSSTSNRDLVTIVPVAVAAIAILLALVLRSLVAPLYLIVSVVLSYLAALGVATLVFIDLGGEGGLSFILPFIMFIFLLALGEDYNILVMTRIREEAHRMPLRQAVVRAVGRTGPTVTSAGIILAGTFAVFAIAGSQGPSGNQIRAIGFGVAIGILMDTFLVRTLLVPSTVALLGRLNWWPSHVEIEPAARSTEASPGAADRGPGAPTGGTSPPAGAAGGDGAPGDAAAPPVGARSPFALDGEPLERHP